MQKTLRFAITLSCLASLTASRASEPRAKDPTVAKEMAMMHILATEAGTSPLSKQIQALQTAIRQKPDDTRRIEQLGRLFITQARVENDDGAYKLAEQCSVVLEAMDPINPVALVIRGHALLAMHKFREAEAVARQLLTIRQEMLDHALLGDALMEQGRLTEAIPVYQTMIDTRPCLPSYSRVAHVRWLKGDLPGAIEMTEEAIACGSYRDPEPMAWVTTRLAFYQWQSGALDLALKTAKRALEILPDYPQAQWVTGRIHLAKGQAGEAVKALEKAVAETPLPELQWALAEAYREAGDTVKADTTEATLKRMGPATDPRSFALYLATRKLMPDRALKLAQAELTSRADVFTLDAEAWALHSAGQSVQALPIIRQALAEGTQDARLLLHAGVIAQAAGTPSDATRWLALAHSARMALLPSEQRVLDSSLAAVAAFSTRPDQPSVVIETATDKP